MTDIKPAEISKLIRQKIQNNNCAIILYAYGVWGGGWWQVNNAKRTVKMYPVHDPTPARPSASIDRASHTVSLRRPRRACRAVRSHRDTMPACVYGSCTSAAIQYGTATLLAHHVGNNIHTHPWHHTSECGDVCVVRSCASALRDGKRGYDLVLTCCSKSTAPLSPMG